MEIRMRINTVQNGFQIHVAESDQGIFGRNYVAHTPASVRSILAEQFEVEMDRVLSAFDPDDIGQE